MDQFRDTDPAVGSGQCYCALARKDTGPFNIAQAAIRRANSSGLANRSSGSVSQYQRARALYAEIMLEHTAQGARFVSVVRSSFRFKVSTFHSCYSFGFKYLSLLTHQIHQSNKSFNEPPNLCLIRNIIPFPAKSPHQSPFPHHTLKPKTRITNGT